MGFNSSIFFAAFSRAGMLEQAVYQPAVGPAIGFEVGFQRPDQIVLDGMVHSADYSIEYQSADIVLKRNYLVQVVGEQYRVKQTPTAKGDGTFFFALLEKVAP